VSFLDTRSYAGTPISRRTNDGYVNATAMCKANGKEWKHYFETDRAHKYLDALSGSVGIPTHQLFNSITVGPNNGRGTWVHPQVAVDLARWISAPFAVWMDSWFLEEVSQVRDTQVPALPAEAQKLEWMMGFCQKWDISLDSRDMLHIKEYAKSLALPPAGGTQSVFNDYPVSRLVQDLFGVVLKNSQYQIIGKNMAKLWRFEMNKEPQKHDQYVDGAVRSVAHYPRDWAETKLRELHAKKPEMFQRN